MRFSTLFAAALVIANVDAVELHSHQKVAAGASARTHARRAASPPRALAQKTSLAQAQANAKKFNMNKLKNKAAKAKSWAADEAAKVKEDAAAAKDAYASGGLQGALDSAKGSAADLKADGQAAAAWTK